MVVSGCVGALKCWGEGMPSYWRRAPFGVGAFKRWTTVLNLNCSSVVLAFLLERKDIFLMAAVSFAVYYNWQPLAAGQPALS